MVASCRPGLSPSTQVSGHLCHCCPWKLRSRRGHAAIRTAWHLASRSLKTLAELVLHQVRVELFTGSGCSQSFSTSCSLSRRRCCSRQASTPAGVTHSHRKRPLFIKARDLYTESKFFRRIYKRRLHSPGLPGPWRAPEAKVQRRAETDATLRLSVGLAASSCMCQRGTSCACSPPRQLWQRECGQLVCTAHPTRTPAREVHGKQSSERLQPLSFV